MILRSITKHVKEQNWFAVALDFCIVVIGILMAFQITEWNEARSKQSLKSYYLQRLESDLSSTISYLEDQGQVVANAITIIDGFAMVLNNDETDDKALVDVTRELFSDGLAITDFKTVRSTFDELNANGNLELLDNQDLIISLVQLHTDYADEAEDSLVNSDWVGQVASHLILNFDWSQFDVLTAHLYSPESELETAEKIRRSKEILRRFAGIHYWYKSMIGKDYINTIAKSQKTLELVRKEMGTH
jgi:hypothetical protein